KEPSIIDDLNHQVSRSGQRPTTRATSARCAPPFFLSDGIPCQQNPSPLSLDASGSDAGRNARVLSSSATAAASRHSRIHSSFLKREVCFDQERAAAARCRG